MSPVQAAITGIGVVAPNGLDMDDYWASVLAGRSGLGHITRFDATLYACRIAGEVPGFAPADHVPGRLVPQTDRWTHLGLAAAAMALEDAGVDPAGLPEYDMAVVTASSSGGTEFGQREIEALWRRGPRSVGAYQSIAWFYAATTGQTSIRYGMRGPCGVLATEQAGGLDALAQARRLLRRGSRMVMTGGTDASLCPYGLAAQTANGLLSRSADPATAYQPFGQDASGYVPGEGGAMFVMEDPAVANGRPYGVLAGYTATFDPPPGVGRPPCLERAVRGALHDAGCDPGDIDVVFADSAGVARLDRVEADAITAVFGPGGVPVTAPKILTGRLYAGGAALDVATALLAIRDGVIPPTAGGYELADGIDLDLVRGAPRPASIRTALVIARGYGGFNAALVLRDHVADTITEGRV
ncbi:ketosynthase chain-length factor [Nonomuraea glycinis]|uniref:ketosynthase chain-length factor n=1 Tax=Nonomuraea glycinis TaxID=2047744 RepID=UPI0033A6657B